MPRSVAFFRNLNLGQGWSPTRPQLVGAFEAAGATEVVNVQVNGTVVFTHPAPRRATDEVLAALKVQTTYDDIAVVRPARWVVDLAGWLRGLEVPEGTATEVVLFDARALPVELPWSTAGGVLTVVRGDRRHAVATTAPGGLRGSSAGPVLQGLTGVKGTARGAGTMLRLAERITRG